MKIKSKKLKECLNENIIEYCKENNIKINNIINESTGEIYEKELLKINYAGFQMEFKSDEKIDGELKELADLLKKMNLQSIEISISTRDRKPKKTNIDLINSLNNDIENIYISGLDLSIYNSEKFSRFNNLKSLYITNSNLSSIELISKLNQNVQLSLYDNPIENNISEDTIRILKKHKAILNFRNGAFYDGYKGELKIKSTKDIDIDTLIKCTDIENILLKKGNIFSNNAFAKHWDDSLYTREEFIKIKKEINNILNQINIPESDAPDKDKKIFSQVYKILGEKIKYNHYLLSDENNNEDIIKKGQNLSDGLIKNTCICAGYAQILDSILNEVGIETQIIHAFPIGKLEFAFTALKYANIDVVELNVNQIENTTKILNYDDSIGHAWNVVELDGKSYLCDLTWDADKIKNGQFPLSNFCCSLNTFMRNGHYRYGEYCYFSEISEISEEDQLKFFGLNEQEIDQILSNSEKNTGEQALESCVQSVSDKIKNSDFKEIERQFSAIQQTKEKQGGNEYDK